MAPQPVGDHPGLEDQSLGSGYRDNGGFNTHDLHDLAGLNDQESRTNGLGIDTPLSRGAAIATNHGDDGRLNADNTLAPSASRRSRDEERGHSTPDTPRTKTGIGGRSSGTLRTCGKCNESLTGQFVRALGGTFHLECFKCRVSKLSVQIAAAKRRCRTVESSSRQNSSL